MNDLFTPWFPGSQNPARPGEYLTDSDGMLIWSSKGQWLTQAGSATRAPKLWCGVTWKGRHLLLALAFQWLESSVNTDNTLRLLNGRIEELAKLAIDQRRRMAAFSEQFTALNHKLDDLRQTRFQQWRAATKIEPPRAVGPFAVSSYSFTPNATAAPPASTSP